MATLSAERSPHSEFSVEGNRKVLREQLPNVALKKRLLAACDEIERLVEQLEALRAALVTAEREASTAHDAIWDKSVAPNQVLHDNDYPTSAQAAIWRLHEAVRPVLETSSPAKKPLL